MSNLFPSPDAFDFSQGLVFYHIKAAGCACFSDARGGGGGGGRTASVPSQPGMPDPAGSRESGQGKGRDAAGSPPCLAVGGGRVGGAWPQLARTGGFVPNAGLAKRTQVQPSSYPPTPQPWACSGLLQLKESREKKAPPLPGPQE